MTSKSVGKRRKSRRAASKVEAVAETITLSELCRKLADPSVDEAHYRKFVELVPNPKGGYAPILVPRSNVVLDDDPLRTRGNWAAGLLNGVYRSRRRKLFEARLKESPGLPILIAEGDSWFQYPMFLKDTIDHLLEHYNVMCLSAAGDELEDMAVKNPEYGAALDLLMKRVGGKVRGFLLSAGGNDIVGDAMAGYLRSFSDGKSAEWHADTPAFRKKLSHIEAVLVSVISTIHKKYPQLPVILHGYDYALPLPDQGPLPQVPPRDGWLGKPLRKKGIKDKTLQRKIVCFMIDSFNIMLARLATTHENVVHVDNRGIVKAHRWNDELHPTDEGFADVARNFRESIK